MNGNVVILGAGSIGRAVEYLIQDKAIKLDLWDKDKTKVENQQALEGIIPAAELVFLCVPSWSIRELTTQIKPLITRDTIVISLSKGLEAKTNLRIDQLITEVLPDNRFVLLSGPMLARLIFDDKPSYACAASVDPEALEKVEQLFNQTGLTLERSDDVGSAAIAGCLKNIYTLILGVVDSLEYGANMKGWIVAQSTQEMSLIAQRLKLNPDSMLGTAGLADLVATGFSPSSNNHRVGRELALHGQTDLQSEGLVSLPSLIALLDGDIGSLPLLSMLQAINQEHGEAAAIFNQWLKS